MADETTGKAKHVGGKIQEAAGDLLGDNKMKRHGRLAQHEGEAEQDEARAEDEAQDANFRKNAARQARKAD